MLTESFEFLKENLFIEKGVDQSQSKISNHINN